MLQCTGCSGQCASGTVMSRLSAGGQKKTSYQEGLCEAPCCHMLVWCCTWHLCVWFTPTAGSTLNLWIHSANLKCIIIACIKLSDLWQKYMDFQGIYVLCKAKSPTMPLTAQKPSKAILCSPCENRIAVVSPSLCTAKTFSQQRVHYMLFSHVLMTF